MSDQWQEFCDRYEELSLEEKQASWNQLDRQERRSFATTWEAYKKSIFKPPHSPPASLRQVHKTKSGIGLKLPLFAIGGVIGLIIWWFAR